MKKYMIIGLLNVVLTLPLSAQNGVGDALMGGNKMMSVIAVVMVILIGIVVYMINMDRRIRKMEDD